MRQAFMLWLAATLAGACAPLGAQSPVDEASGLGGSPLFAPQSIRVTSASDAPVVLWQGEAGALMPERRVGASGGWSVSFLGGEQLGFSSNSHPDLFRFAAAQGAAGWVPPLRPREKFKLALKRSFYPGPLAVSAMGAGWSMWIDSDLDDGYGQGFDGFLRRWGARVAFKGTRHLVGTFALASVLKQDPRYHPSRNRGVGRRAGYAVSRVFVTRTRAGLEQFNLSNIGGMAAAAGLANTWYRSQDAGGKETAARFGIAIALDAAIKLFSEFVVHRNAPRD